MDKLVTSTSGNSSPQSRRVGTTMWVACSAVSFFVVLVALHYRLPSIILRDNLQKLLGDATLATPTPASTSTQDVSLYPRFPLPNDPFHFIPCTDSLSLPPLHDSDAKGTWGALFDPNPDHWSWGDHVIVDHDEENENEDSGDGDGDGDGDGYDDPYAGRGIYLCGYLDLPLDYLNDSDTRIVRLAVTKFQVSGLAPVDSPTGAKSERTIILEPGGPGASGT